MLIQKFGIKLRSIGSDDIETIRLWRNQEFVRNNMHHTQVISVEQQAVWYKELDKRSNLYFIIRYKEIEIGLINLKEINWQTGEAEAGIFIGNENYLNTIVPILATIVLMDFSFDVLKLKYLKAKVNKRNSEAIRFNQSIGYIFNEDIDKEFTYYTCTVEQFKKAVTPLRITADKLSKQSAEIILTSEEVARFSLDKNMKADFKLTIL